MRFLIVAIATMMQRLVSLHFTPVFCCIDSSFGVLINMWKLVHILAVWIVLAGFQVLSSG